jgi:hypothetical protein
MMIHIVITSTSGVAMIITVIIALVMLVGGSVGA